MTYVWINSIFHSFSIFCCHLRMLTSISRQNRTLGGQENWLSARKNLRGSEDNRPLVFKTIGYCFYCSFCCFFENFRGQKSSWGKEEPSLPRVAENQENMFVIQDNVSYFLKHLENRKALSVHIYCIWYDIIRIFKLQRRTRLMLRSPIHSLKIRMTSHPCNKYEQTMLSCLLNYL